MLENLIDEIYEAAAVPESWAGVSRQIATIADAVGALVISAQGSRTSWVSSSPEFDALVQRYYAFEGVEERTFRLVKAGHAGFLRDYDVFTPVEMASKPMFQLLRDMGAGSGIATAISSPSGDAFVIHAERNFVKGPASAHIVATLDYLRPHLARAALLSSRLQMEKARSAMAALQQLSLPACLIGWNGRVLEANPLFQSLIPGTVLDRRERLCLANPQADQLLRVAIQEKGTSIVRSIPVPARDNEPPYILHLDSGAPGRTGCVRRGIRHRGADAGKTTRGPGCRCVAGAVRSQSGGGKGVPRAGTGTDPGRNLRWFRREGRHGAKPAQVSDGQDRTSPSGGRCQTVAGHFIGHARSTALNIMPGDRDDRP